MESYPAGSRGFNLFLFTLCLIAMPIYLAGMVIALSLSKLEKPDPFERVFGYNQEKTCGPVPVNREFFIGRSCGKSPI